MLRFKVDIALAREGELMLQGWAFGSNPEEEVKLTAGHTLLVSAEAENVTLAPEGETTILESYV